MKKSVALIIAFIMLFAVPALAECELNVNGSGTVMVEADVVQISLGVSKLGPDLAKLQQDVNGTVEAICAALEERGVAAKDISTNYLYIYPQYDYSQEIAQMVGYSVNNNLTFKTERIDTVGALIDAAFSAGANSFESISFSLKDETMARNRALELAVQNAFEKAEVIAKASGKAIEGIETIDEIVEEYGYNNSASGSAKVYATEDAAVSGTAVRAAQVAVTANVKITFEIR